MWKEIVRIMNEAAVEGISQSRAGYNPKDEDFYNALRHSNEVFSTFKVHTFGVEMASKLFDSNGNLRSFGEWTKATMGIASHQVGSWLETEYNTAIIRAHQAADWQEFVRNKDIFPNLRWMMTTSPDPEDTHKHYWMTGLTLPIDDPFWNKHYPGDRWNCKCSLEATADPIVRPADIKEEKPQRGLDTNAGKTGELFSSTHPYFPKDCSHCFAKKNAPFTIQNAFQRFFNADNDKTCKTCRFLANCTDKLSKKARKQIEEETYEEVEGSNGLVRISSKHGKNEREENKEIALYLAKKKGWQIDLVANPDREKSADTFNKTLAIFQEYKVNRKEYPTMGSIDNLLRKGNTQCENIVLRIDSAISMSDLSNAMNSRLLRANNQIKQVTVIIGEKDATYSASQIQAEGFKIKPADFE